LHRAEGYAAALSFSTPEDFPSLLEAVYGGFDRALLAERATLLRSPVVVQVVGQLHVQDVIRSYAVADLLSAYVPGSREWLYHKLEAWLDTVAPLPGSATNIAAAIDQKADGESEQPPPALQHGSMGPGCRMFLLMAGPGMGKSVFSAIARNKLLVRSTSGRGVVTAQHFFKIGQPRAQGKVMVLCLAHQLAERLPGLAELLVPVVKEHGDAADLSMTQAFEK
jgi:hypothetical protein